MLPNLMELFHQERCNLRHPETTLVKAVQEYMKSMLSLHPLHKLFALKTLAEQAIFVPEIPEIDPKQRLALVAKPCRKTFLLVGHDLRLSDPRLPKENQARIGSNLLERKNSS
jgi:hypothetical protein